MKLKKIVILLPACFFLIFASVFSNNNSIQAAEAAGTLTLTGTDRILILAPHPDDEILGCGGIIQKAKAMGLPLKVVFLTYGDNNQWSFLIYRKHPVLTAKGAMRMGMIRHDEAVLADKLLGLSPDQQIFLGYPDYKTLNIWYAHWGNSLPERGMLSVVKAVPYASAYRPGAPYKGEEIVADLKKIIREFRPTKIFLSHPADHNPDHMALYLFTRVALWDLEKEIKPEIFPYLIHYKKWPRPAGYRKSLALSPPKIFQTMLQWRSFALTPAEVKLNYKAIQKHRSQYNASRRYLLSFIRTTEIFGDFEPVRLTLHAPQSTLNLIAEGEPAKFPEQLTAEERARFVGIERCFVAEQDDHLIMTTELSRPIGKAVNASIYVFGYRSDTDFNNMPKLHIKFGTIGYRVFDQGNLLPRDTISVDRTPRKIVIRIPLEVLGKPQRILTSTHTYMGMIPLDWAAWRVLELTDQTGG